MQIGDSVLLCFFNYFKKYDTILMINKRISSENTKSTLSMQLGKKELSLLYMFQVLLPDLQKCYFSHIGTFQNNYVQVLIKMLLVPSRKSEKRGNDA